MRPWLRYGLIALVALALVGVEQGFRRGWFDRPPPAGHRTRIEGTITNRWYLKVPICVYEWRDGRFQSLGCAAQEFDGKFARFTLEVRVPQPGVYPLVIGRAPSHQKPDTDFYTLWPLVLGHQPTTQLVLSEVAFLHGLSFVGDSVNTRWLGHLRTLYALEKQAQRYAEAGIGPDSVAGLRAMQRSMSAQWNQVCDTAAARGPAILKPSLTVLRMAYVDSLDFPRTYTDVADYVRREITPGVQQADSARLSTYWFPFAVQRAARMYRAGFPLPQARLAVDSLIGQLPKGSRLRRETIGCLWLALAEDSLGMYVSDRYRAEAPELVVRQD